MPLPYTVIDLHAHILPGMDHGSRELAEALLQCRMLAERGVGAVVATPHFYAQREASVDDFIARRDAAWEALSAAFGDALRIHPAAEVLLFRGLENMAGLDRLCIKGTHTILLEMPLGGFGRPEVEAVERIAALGLTPVIAHIDRYPASSLALLDESGVAQYQVNAEAFLGFGRRSAAFRAMAKDGRIAAIGSDLHETDRRAIRAFSRALMRLGSATEEVMQRTRTLLPE